MNHLIEARPIFITPYDTTLRDGAQDPRAQLNVGRKRAIAEILVKWRMPFIEGGWPGANIMDTEFFQEVKNIDLQSSQLVTFGMTARIGTQPENDTGLNHLLTSDTKFVTIVGKTWLQHVQRALKTEGIPNLDTIYSSVAFLTGQGREVFFDAEHWFDGYAQDPEYAIQALAAAKAGGASALVLCDTRGSCTPEAIARGTRTARKRLPNIEIGIHTHNDSGMAVYNAIAAIKAGATQVQGTINGVGERTGNADLCVVLPNAELKYNIRSKYPIDLSQTKAVAEAVAKQNKVPVPPNNPYTGDQAFAHKAGLHTSGQERDEDGYQHINPKLVGNHTIYINSEQGGSANLEAMAKKHGFELSRNDPNFAVLLDRMKDIGVFGDAQEFFFLDEVLGSGTKPFTVTHRRVVTDNGSPPEAKVSIDINGALHIVAAEGNGPINAIDIALKKIIREFYPVIDRITLSGYDIPPNTQLGTDAEVVVEMKFEGDGISWTSKAKGTNQQKAGEDALITGYQYFLRRRYQQKDYIRKSLQEALV